MEDKCEPPVISVYVTRCVFVDCLLGKCFFATAWVLHYAHKDPFGGLPLTAVCCMCECGGGGRHNSLRAISLRRRRMRVCGT